MKLTVGITPDSRTQLYFQYGLAQALLDRLVAQAKEKGGVL